MLNDRKKGQESKSKKYRGKKPQNKTSPEPEAETDLQGRFADLEGCTFDLGPRAPETFTRTMKELERYLGETYSDRCHTSVMTETTATFPDLEIPTMTNLGTERSETDGDMGLMRTSARR